MARPGWPIMLLLVVGLGGCIGGPAADCAHDRTGDNGEFRGTATLSCDGVLGGVHVAGPLQCADLEVWLGYDLSSHVDLALFRDGTQIRIEGVSGHHEDDRFHSWDAVGEASYHVTAHAPRGTTGLLLINLVCDA